MYIRRTEDNSIFYESNNGLYPLEVADVGSFRVLKDATLSDEQIAAINRYRRKDWIANELMATDGVTVWFRHCPVPEADAATFEYFRGGQCNWGRDKNQLYCFYYEGKNWIKYIKSRSPQSFAFFDFDDEPQKSVSAYSRMYARDAKYVYYYGRRVKGANPLLSKV